MADVMLSEGQVVKVRWAYTRLGTTAYIVRHYQLTLVVGTVLLSDAAQAMDLQLTSVLYGCMCNDTTWWGCEASPDVTGPGPDRAVSNTTFSLSLWTPPCFPHQCAALISLGPDYVGYSARGRVFIPFVPISGRLNPEQWTGDYLAQLEGAAAGLLAQVNIFTFNGSGLLSPVIYHRLSATTSRILRSQVRQGMATQRRRGACWFPPEPLPWS